MIAVIEEAKELFLDVEHPEGTVLHLDPVVAQTTGDPDRYIRRRTSGR